MITSEMYLINLNLNVLVNNYQQQSIDDILWDQQPTEKSVQNVAYQREMYFFLIILFHYGSLKLQ